jgi:hypothetical protein
LKCAISFPQQPRYPPIKAGGRIYTSPKIFWGLSATLEGFFISWFYAQKSSSNPQKIQKPWELMGAVYIPGWEWDFIANEFRRRQISRRKNLVVFLKNRPEKFGGNF